MKGNDIAFGGCDTLNDSTVYQTCHSFIARCLLPSSEGITPACKESKTPVAIAGAEFLVSSAPSVQKQQNDEEESEQRREIEKA